MHKGQVTRRVALAGLGALGAAGAASMAFRSPTPLASAIDDLKALPNTDRMPALFVGHGTPMAAIQPNQWTDGWGAMGRQLPRPRAILAISAHWLTQGGSLVTASEKPAMNYDMHGFPSEIYEYRYPSPGDPALAREIAGTLEGQLPVYPDTEWGYDHGTWLVLKYLFPGADIPVLQMSIDFSKPPAFHYELAKHLRVLRSKGVLILGSGNVVHNLRHRPGSAPAPFDWAIEFDQRISTAIHDGNHRPAIDFLQLGALAEQSHPSYDHFLPLLYCLGLSEPGGTVQSFLEGFQWPAVSMRSFLVA